jgi:CBS domain-containing protein
MAAMRLHARSSLAVVDAGGAAVGVITRTDLLRRDPRDPSPQLAPDRPVRDAMSSPVLTVEEDEDLGDAARRMIDHRVHRLFASKGNELSGVLGTLEIMRAVSQAHIDRPMAEIMRTPVITVRATETIAVAADRLREANISGLVVVDDEWPVGLFTQREALEAAALPATARVEDAMSPALLCLQVETPLHRAAAQAAATRSRRILAVENRRIRGIITGLDFARLVAGPMERAG